MANTYKIYTAGKMGGLPFKEQMAWRKEIENKIRNRSEAKITFVHPPLFYTYGENLHHSEREVMVWDLSQVADCDILIVDLSTISSSIGTIMEIGAAEAINQFGNKHIHVIGVGKPDTSHPWINEAMLRTETNIDDAIDYIVNYLLL